MIARTDLSVVRGDTAYFDVAVTNDGDGTAFDLTGCTATFTAKSSRAAPDSAALFQKTIGSGITITGAATAGRFRVKLLATDLAAMSPRISYVYDIQIKNAAGDIITPSGLTGKLTAEGDVTRATS